MTAPPNQLYTVEAADVLDQWGSLVMTNVAEATFEVSDPAAPVSTQRFYRVRGP